MQRIGKIVAAHGIKGDVIIAHEVVPPLQTATWDCLMIELNPNSYIPFFIESIEETTEGELICKLEEINAREETRSVLNKAVFTSINYTVKTESENGFGQYIGFTIYNGNTKAGVIDDILEGGAQLLFQVNYQEHNVLIPAVEVFITKIDVSKKIIHMNLPEGLLEL